MPVITGYIQESVDKGLEMESLQGDTACSTEMASPPSVKECFLTVGNRLKDIAGSDIIKLEDSHHNWTGKG